MKHITRAVVTHVIHEDDPYAVAESSGVPDSVTFSLSPGRGIWSEDVHPTVGAEVVLGDIRSVRGKWRAYKARFYRPSDEQGE